MVTPNIDICFQDNRVYEIIIFAYVLLMKTTWNMAINLETMLFLSKYDNSK